MRRSLTDRQYRAELVKIVAHLEARELTDAQALTVASSLIAVILVRESYGQERALDALTEIVAAMRRQIIAAYHAKD